MFELLTKVQRLQIDYLWQIPIEIKCSSQMITITVGDVDEDRRRWYVGKGDDEYTRNKTLLEICEYVISIQNA